MAAQASWQASAFLQDQLLGGLLQHSGQAPGPEAVDYLSRAKRQRVCNAAPDSDQPPPQQQAAPAGPGPLPPFLMHPALCQQLERSGLSFAFPTENLPPSPPPVRPESPAPVPVPASASGEFQPGPGSRSDGLAGSGGGLTPPPHQPQQQQPQQQQQQLAAADYALRTLQQAAATSLLGPGPWHHQQPTGLAHPPQQAAQQLPTQPQPQQQQDVRVPQPSTEPANKKGSAPQQQQEGPCQQEQSPPASREQQLEEAMGAVVRLLLALQNRVAACEAGRASSDAVIDTVRTSVAKLAGVVTKLHHNAHAMLSQHHCQLQMLWEARGGAPRPEGAPPAGASTQAGGPEDSRLEGLVLQLMQQASTLGQALQEETAQRIAVERRLDLIEQALQQGQGRGQG